MEGFNGNIIQKIRHVPFATFDGVVNIQFEEHVLNDFLNDHPILIPLIIINPISHPI